MGAIGGSSERGSLNIKEGNTVRTMLDRIAVPTSLDVELKIKLSNQGANAGERLSFGLNGKGLRGNAIAANRTREIRPSGMRGELVASGSQGLRLGEKRWSWWN